MRPTPIPDMEANAIGGRRMVILPPSGDLLDPDCAAVEAIVTSDGFYVRIVLDEGDLALLARGNPIWLHFHSTRMPVWSIGIAGEAEQQTLEGR